MTTKLNPCPMMNAIDRLRAALEAEVKIADRAYRASLSEHDDAVLATASYALVILDRAIPDLRAMLAAAPAQQPAAAVPEGGLRDSVLNSAKFRASCYALVGIVEGIEGLGRNWAANGERLKDTREWVAFYNCVASMRNGTFNQASAAPAQQPAAGERCARECEAEAELGGAALAKARLCAARIRALGDQP